MRRTILVFALVAATALSYAVSRHREAGAASETGKRVLYYVDPMHPSYKSDKPGTAPDCGMQLEPVFATQTATGQHSSALHIPDDVQRAVGIQMAVVRKRESTVTVRTVGRVEAEDVRTYKINAGTDGFIRETFRDSVGNRVAKDQILASFYSPEFLAATSGFIAATERVPGSVSNEGARSVQNYSDRLRNLGMSDRQISEISTSRKLPESIQIVSPSNGVILGRNVSPGQHFEHEMELYRIADLRKVWVRAEVEEQDVPEFRPAMRVTVSRRDSGEAFTGYVTNSLPEWEREGGSAKVRLEIDNPRLSLRPDMVVNVENTNKVDAAITIPADAVIDAGFHPRVYVEQPGGAFQVRAIEIGWEREDEVQVLKGLRPGERVVANGAFLIDSESRMQRSQDSASSSANVGEGQRPAAGGY